MSKSHHDHGLPHPHRQSDPQQSSTCNSRVIDLTETRRPDICYATGRDAIYGAKFRFAPARFSPPATFSVVDATPKRPHAVDRSTDEFS